MPLVEGFGAKEDAGNHLHAGQTALGGAQFIGSISGNTLTVGEEITGYQNAGGGVTITDSYPLFQPHLGGQWSNFQIPEGNTLPSDASIQGMYVVVVAIADNPPGFRSLTWQSQSFPVPNGFINPGGGIPAGGPFFGEFYGDSIGTSLSLIPTVLVNMEAFSSIGPIHNQHWGMQVGAVGLAIYYTSAVPSINPQIPPPFPVPPGIGLQWALPFSATGADSVDGIGGADASPAAPILNPVTATISGTIRVGQTVTGPGVTPAPSSPRSFPPRSPSSPISQRHRRRAGSQRKR